MTSDNWQLIWQICEKARQLPPADRPGYVHAHTPSAEIAREVLALLAEPEESVFPSWNLTGSSTSGGGATAVTTSRAMTGARIGRYLIGDPVGRGASGDVYTAHDTELERTVAMKFFKPDTSEARWKVEWLLREAKAASALNHPSIITVHEVIQSESGLAIVMEFVDGAALRKLCAEPNPSDRVVRMGSQIAGALAAAHGRRIIHRDIKPENIMVRPDGLVKVLDFGLAKVQGRLEESLLSQLRVGTLRYMSPEQANGEKLTEATDIFSLGLVLYELAAGRHPFPGEGAIATLRSISSETPDPPSRWRRDIPKPLDALIMRMLARSPEERPTAAEVTRRLGDLARPAPGAHQRPWRKAAWAAAAVAALTGALWFGRRTPQKLAIPSLTPIPLTATHGFDSWPDVSPNGETVVFGWGESPDSYSHLYLKHFEQDAPVKLVEAEPGTRVGHAKWSPDGQLIYYKKTSPNGGMESIWSISPDGTNQRKVASLFSGELSSGIDCSPDGKRILVADRPAVGRRFAIQSINLATGEKSVLTSPEDGWGDWDPRYSPGGETIAFKRVKGGGDDQLFVMPAQGGPPRQLTARRHSIFGHSWLPQNQILVSSQIGSVIHGLWRISASNPSDQQAVFESGLDAVMPSVGRHKLVWVNRANDYNIYSAPAAGGPAVKRIASTMLDSRPAFAPDGRLAYVSRRSGSPEVWITRPDASQSVRISDLKGDLGRPAWSPDGLRIAFSMQRFGVTTVYLAHCAAGELRCDSPTPLVEGANPTWSLDGGFLYYSAGLPEQIWKIPAAGGPAVRLAPGLEALPSRDGKWLYFTGVYSGPRFLRFRMTADGGITGPEETVLERGTNSAGILHWTLAGDEIFFWESNINSKFSGLRACNVKTRRLRTVVEARAAEYPAVSPDGKTVWYAQPDAAGGTVTAAEWNK